MRRAVAVFCCAIVGLEILIGVPLAVCIGFLVVAEQSSSPWPPMTASAGPFDPYSTAPQAPMLPPPSMDPPPRITTPLAYAEPPSYSPSLPAGPVAPVPPSQDPTSPVPDAVLDSRAEIGSPLVGSTLEPSTTEPGPGNAFAAAFEKVAVEEESSAPAPTLEVPPAEAVSASPPTTALPAASTSCQPMPLLDALQVAVDRLYELANGYESRGDFSRADAARALARGIRQEKEVIARDFPTALPPAQPLAQPETNRATPTTLPPSSAEIPTLDEGAN